MVHAIRYRPTCIIMHYLHHNAPSYAYLVIRRCSYPGWCTPYRIFSIFIFNILKGRTVMGNATARTFAFIYALTLHLLVFLVSTTLLLYDGINQCIMNCACLNSTVGYNMRRKTVIWRLCVRLVRESAHG